MPRSQSKLLKPVKVGSVSIPRYRLSDGRIMIAYPTATEKRKCRAFVDPAKAKAEAERIARELHNGGAESIAFSSADRASFAQASRDVAPFAVPVHVATAEWSEAKKQIGRHPFSAVIDAGVKALSRTIHPLPDVAQELLLSKAQKDLHGRYRRGLESTLEKIATAFPGDISTIRAGELEKYLVALDVGPRRRDNILSEIRHLFRFARLRGYLSDTITEAAKVQSLDHMSGTISIYTPVEMQILLAHVKEEWLPYLLIAGFTGVRSEEIALAKDASRRKDSLRWSDFDWDEREINIRAETAKTGVPRRCPILENLYEWLRPWRDARATGPIIPSGMRPDREFGKESRLIRVINRAQKKDTTREFRPLCWRHNALRHSYGSYRMAAIKNMQQLSYEMGNSLAMIKRHYHNPRPISEAKAWFAICPDAPGNIHQIPFAFAAA